MSGDEITFGWLPGTLVAPELLNECAQLYSQHYGVWSARAPKLAGMRIRLSESRIRGWLSGRGRPAIWYARSGKTLIGYAIAVQDECRGYGRISWVTQLVVHTDFRRRSVGKRLLFSIWGFSDDYAWGLLSANPYAIRALEKATRRRCQPAIIAEHARRVESFARRNIHYFPEKKHPRVSANSATIDTGFLVDHSNVSEKIRNVESEHAWLLGPLEEGHEWFAFTFREQPQIPLSPDELSKMLAATDDIAKDAYSRMTLDENHTWAKHAPYEVEKIVAYCQLRPGSSVLDVGSGNGRHCIELSKRGMNCLGTDFAETLVTKATKKTAEANVSGVQFRCEDFRSAALGRQFDAVICLYDVIGTYPENADNQRIIGNLAKHVKAGGHVLISVMNYESTEHFATNTFSLEREPDKLLALAPSNVMEKTGNIFDPRYLMIDPQTQVVYRYEQFVKGTELPIQLLVRDRRFKQEEVESMCESAGLKVEWSRIVRAGDWETSLDPRDVKAKEILLLCRKPERD